MWTWAVFLLQAMHPTAPPSCTKNVLTQLLVRKRLRPHAVRIFEELTPKKKKKSTHRHTTTHTLHYHHLVTSLSHSSTDLWKRSRWALVFLSADFLVERDNDVCVCETPCNMTRYSKELSFVKIPSKASAKYLAKKYNKSEQYIKWGSTKRTVQLTFTLSQEGTCSVSRYILLQRKRKENIYTYIHNKNATFVRIQKYYTNYATKINNSNNFNKNVSNEDIFNKIVLYYIISHYLFVLKPSVIVCLES